MANAMKGKKNLILFAAIASVVVIILIIAFFPGAEKNTEQGPQVISKRVKLNLIDETVNVQERDLKLDEDDKPHTRPVPVSSPAPEPAPEPVVKSVAARAEATPAAEKEPAPVKKAVVKKPAPKAATASVDRSTLAARKPWAINVASFPDAAGARKLEKSLDAAGYNAYITGFSKDGVNWSRVRVGFYSSKEDAQRAGNAIKSRYDVQSPWIVKPARDETAKYIR